MANQKLASEIIGKIFKNPDMQYGLSVFEGINPELVLNFFEKDGKYYLQCLKRNKSIVAKPEEIIRQLMVYKLINYYKYLIEGNTLSSEQLDEIRLLISDVVSINDLSDDEVVIRDYIVKELKSLIYRNYELTGEIPDFIRKYQKK